MPAIMCEFAGMARAYRTKLSAYVKVIQQI